MPRKRTRSAIILEILRNGALTTADIFANAALAPFHVSYKGMPALLGNKRISFRDTLATIEADREEHRKFYSTLINLKRDGLVAMDNKTREVSWSISQKGKRELLKARGQPEYRYPKHTSKHVLVISYDIPEKYRATRGWLRSVLKLLDFKLLHQSVWIGKTEIPESLLTDLHKKKVHTYVHIFTVGKEGSLTQVL